MGEYQQLWLGGHTALYYNAYDGYIVVLARYVPPLELVREMILLATVTSFYLNLSESRPAPKDQEQFMFSEADIEHFDLPSAPPPPRSHRLYV